MSISLSNSTLRCQDQSCGEDDECHVEAYEEAVFEAVGEVVLWRFMKAFSRLSRVEGSPSLILIHSHWFSSEFGIVPGIRCALGILNFTISKDCIILIFAN